jgi:hypothetical protein
MTHSMLPYLILEQRFFLTEARAKVNAGSFDGAQDRLFDFAQDDPSWVGISDGWRGPKL